MSGFDQSWLALREIYDHRARSRPLTAAFIEALGPSPRLVDLGCGTGSNLRYLAPHLGGDEQWRCIDVDKALLHVLEHLAPSDRAIEGEHKNLASDLEDLAIEPGAGVTASALLDLTSAAWLDRLALKVKGHPVLIALSFDGRMDWTPSRPDDKAVLAMFLAHQRTDKGFGPALGPDAARYFVDRLQSSHEVRQATSDWTFKAADGAIMDAMLDDMLAMAPKIDRSFPIQAWHRARKAELDADRLQMTVGHVDILALPKDHRSATGE